MPNLGIIVPDMGMNDSLRPGKVSEAAARYAAASLSGALFTTTQQRVLACLFGESGRSYAVNELIQATGAGSGAVQRELARLAGSGLLTVEHVGNQKRYRANPESPVFDELRGIVLKTAGLADPLREALSPLADRIDGGQFRLAEQEVDLALCSRAAVVDNHNPFRIARHHIFPVGPYPAAVQIGKDVVTAGGFDHGLRHAKTAGGDRHIDPAVVEQDPRARAGIGDGGRHCCEFGALARDQCCGVIFNGKDASELEQLLAEPNLIVALVGPDEAA